MNEKEAKTQNLLKKLVENRDIASLDVLFTLAYSSTCMSGHYCKNKSYKNQASFQNWMRRLGSHNIKIKHNLKVKEAKEKLGVLIDLFDIPNFLPDKSSTYDADKLLFKNILISNSREIMKETIDKQLQNASEKEKKVLSFLLNYIPLKLEESQKAGQSYDQNSKYAHLPPDFHVHGDEKSGEILYYEIHPKEWTYKFNEVFNEKLGSSEVFRLRNKSNMGFLVPQITPPFHKELLWEFGDVLVKLGIGYWTPYISATGNLSIEFTIPEFLYEHARKYKDALPEVDRDVLIQSIENGDNDFIDVEGVDVEASEKEIEDSIINNPEIIEKGLKLIKRQNTTDVGIIDILCLDKNDNYVVIELKKGKASDKVVGQIQRYMAWVGEGLADKERVRGIIVAQDYDTKLEYAIKGSKYPVEVKIFGEDAPVEENIKYCDKCGEVNRKSAKFCAKCGNEFWLE
jgi:hypothetical protein